MRLEKSVPARNTSRRLQHSLWDFVEGKRPKKKFQELVISSFSPVLREEKKVTWRWSSYAPRLPKCVLFSVSSWWIVFRWKKTLLYTQSFLSLTFSFPLDSPPFVCFFLSSHLFSHCWIWRALLVHVVGILNDAMRQGRPSIASVWPTRSDPRRQLGASAFRQLQRNGITQLYTKQRKKKGVIIKRRKRDWESKQKEKRRTRLDSFECLLIYPVVMYVPSKWKLCGRSREKKREVVAREGRINY